MKLPLKAGLASLCLSIILSTGLSPAAFGQIQGGFIPSSDVVVDMSRQPDGKIIMVGGFPGGMKRVDANGTRDDTFNPPGFGWNLLSHTVQNDGKLIVGGDFTVGQIILARLNVDGSSDSTFSAQVNPQSGGSGYILSISVASDGRVYIAGQFATVGGTSRPNVARLNSNGTLDSSFGNTQVDGEVRELLILSDGKVLLGGVFNNVGGSARVGIARLNADGTRDASFVGPVFGGAGDVFAIAAQSDGRFLIAGSFTIADGQRTHTNVARLNADGTIDPTFFIGSQDTQTVPIYSVAVQSNGRILVGGGVNRFAPFGPSDFRTVLANRFNADGFRDDSLGSHNVFPEFGNEPRVYSLISEPDGKVVAAGAYRSSAVGYATRINTDKTLDVPFSRFDYDGDRRTDLSVYRPSNNTTYMLGSQTYSFFQFGANGDVPAPADWDGDGKTDIAVFRSSNGTWYWINSSSNTFSYLTWGESGDQPVPNVMLGRRKAVHAVYRPSNRRFYRAVYDNGAITLIDEWQLLPDPPAEDRLMVGTYMSPFQTTLVSYRPSTSTFRRFAGNNSSVCAPITLGQPGDIPVSGDFDGDYLTDFAVYRPTTGLWTIRRSSNNTTYTQSWGEAGDIPIPGDYDGDQRDDIAVFRPSNGTWYIIGSTEGWRIQQFGQAGDIPLPSSYLP